MILPQHADNLRLITNMKKLTHEEINSLRTPLDKIGQAEKVPLYVILNSIRSNYNVGSIFRTSDAAMISKLILCGYTPAPPKKEILKTALGATESVEWEYIKDPKEAICSLKEKGIKICALEITTRSRKYYEVCKNDFPLCMIVGNEITGVSNDLLELCDFSLEIPQYGIKHSLNVAVAYGIAAFELRKVWGESLP
jgi:23S rRNA (guanosine2251-2'-O)-methyltransferase